MCGALLIRTSKVTGVLPWGVGTSVLFVILYTLCNLLCVSETMHRNFFKKRKEEGPSLLRLLLNSEMKGNVGGW